MFIKQIKYLKYLLKDVESNIKQQAKQIYLKLSNKQFWLGLFKEIKYNFIQKFRQFIDYIAQQIKQIYLKLSSKQFWIELLKKIITKKFWEEQYQYFFVELQKPKVFSDSLFDQIDLHIRLICIFFYYLFLLYYIILIVGCWLLSVFGIL